MKNRIGFSVLASFTLLAGCAQNNNNPEIVKETYIHKYGVTVSKNDWTSRGGDGEVVLALNNGVEIRKNYRAGKLHGTTTYTFPHSRTIEKTETYEDDLLVKETTNYPSGIPKQEVIYLADGGTKKTTWFETGTPKSVEELFDNSLQFGEYYTLANQVESNVEEGQGTRTVRDAYGQLKSTDTFEIGEMISQMTYHTNGTPKSVIPFRNGKVEGRLKTFLPGGEPNTIETWLSGEQHGLTTTFQNGEKFSEVTFVHGKKQGLERRFRNGDVVEEEISWSDDQRHGPSYSYVGDNIQTFWYYRGDKVTKQAYDKLCRGIVR